MNVPEAFQLMVTYFAYRQRNIEIFEQMTLKDTLIQQALYDGFPGVLANRDRYVTGSSDYTKQMNQEKQLVPAVCFVVVGHYFG